MFEKERMEKDVLNRLTWDQSLNKSDFSLVYIDRITKELIEEPMCVVVHCGDFFRLGTTTSIPVHRIRQFKHRGKIVWEKRRNKGKQDG